MLTPHLSILVLPLKLKQGNVTKKSGTTTEKYLGNNLKTEFKNDSSKATFTIGLKKTFKKVTIEDTIEDKEANKKLAVNKKSMWITNLKMSRPIYIVIGKGADNDKGNG